MKKNVPLDDNNSIKKFGPDPQTVDGKKMTYSEIPPHWRLDRVSSDTIKKFKLEKKKTILINLKDKYNKFN